MNLGQRIHCPSGPAQLRMSSSAFNQWPVISLDTLSPPVTPTMTAKRISSRRLVYLHGLCKLVSYMREHLVVADFSQRISMAYSNSEQRATRPQLPLARALVLVPLFSVWTPFRVIFSILGPGLTKATFSAALSRAGARVPLLAGQTLRPPLRRRETEVSPNSRRVPNPR
jgi:hypothetical protein